MDRELGLLPAEEPLHAFLANEVFGNVLGVRLSQPVFEMHALHAALVIVRFTERHSGVAVACKFYGRKPPAGNRQAGPAHFEMLMNREFNNLCWLWGLGFDRPPYRVVQPLGTHAESNYALVEEYVAGPKLDDFLKRALHQGEEQRLYNRLTDLAGFLARLHNQTQTNEPTNPQIGLNYFDKMIRQLSEKEIISGPQANRLAQLRDRWAGAGILDSALKVIIHGDATPVNFVFGSGGEVVAIDLERLRAGDPMADAGCVAAELRHLFFLTTSNPLAGESFIQHFYAHYYDERRAHSHEDFEVMTNRARFWMGLTELRICRNDWLDRTYRQRLAEEAERCLSW
jgi:aminoglycoside phosphotransferase (APT) family kinase protein